MRTGIARMHLEDAAAFIPYGCMVDEFQHIVYEHPELTPQERRQAEWRKLEQVYKPHLDYEGNTFSSRMEASGRSSSTFTTLRSTILIMYWRRPVRLCTRSGWRRTVRRRGRAICSFVSFLACKFYSDMLHTVGLEVPYEEGCIARMAEKLEELRKKM